MPARTLSRLPRAITASVAAGALTLAATTSAGAAPYNVETSRHCDCGPRVGSGPPGQLFPRAKNFAARGAKAPIAEPAPGQPTWPLHPKPLHSTSSQQVASSAGDDFESPWTASAARWGTPAGAAFHAVSRTVRCPAVELSSALTWRA
jgi:hypothetical protein